MCYFSYNDKEYHLSYDIGRTEVMEMNKFKIEYYSITGNLLSTEMVKDTNIESISGKIVSLKDRPLHQIAYIEKNNKTVEFLSMKDVAKVIVTEQN